MRTITASYNSFVDFKIPSNVPLLSVEENNKVKNGEKIAWSWCIIWGSIYYYDADLNTQEIPANDDEEEQTWSETCVDCEKLMGGKKFTNEEEFDEHPDREDGYDDDGDWHCPECKNEDEESDDE